MKRKHPMLKRTGMFILICALSLSSLLISNIQTTSAANTHFNKNSVTSKSWNSIKPKVQKWIKKGIPYASPCSYLINWKQETAAGLDCSGFVNTMVHLYYEDGKMNYDWQSYFSSSSWSYGLEAAGLQVLESWSKDAFNQAYRQGKIQDGDIIVFSNGWSRGVHVALVYGKNNKGEVLLAHEYGNHLQTTTFNNVYDWDFGNGNYSYYEVFAGTPRKNSEIKTLKKVTKQTVDLDKLKKKEQKISVRSGTAKNTKKLYSLVSVPQKAKKYFKLTQTGSLTVKKGLRKGTYLIKVKETAINLKKKTTSAVIKKIKISVN